MKCFITLNGVKVTKELPTSWKQVTFRQYLRWIRAKNITEVISIFTEVDLETLAKVGKINGLDKVVACLSFLNREPVPMVIPDQCLGYKIVKNLDTESVAQYADLLEILSKFKEKDLTNLDQYPLIVATYAVDPYDFKQAEQLAGSFLNAPCGEVLAIANFTQAKLIASNSGIPRTYRPAAIPLSKLRLAMINWLRRSAFIIRFYLWKRTLPSPVRNYLNGQ